MINGKPFHPTRQRGAALIITLMISVLLSLLGMYGAGILVLDTRSAANDFRAREAMAAAESGTEQGLSLLNANRGRILAGGLDINGDGTADTGWAPCGTEAWCLPIRSDDRANWQFLTISNLSSPPDAGSFTLHLLTLVPDADPDVKNGSRLVYNIVAIGKSADTTSTATLKQGAYFYQILRGNVGTPIAAGSNVPLSGNYSIITNSNGGGTGVPVSVWSGPGIAVTPDGSFASCHIDDFEDPLKGKGTACPASDALSKKNLTGPDMVVNDPNFPPDLFQFLFGVPAEEFQTIKDQATVVANCDGLSALSSGLIWVEKVGGVGGNCKPPGNVGTAASPVLLVVEGDTTLNGASYLYGLLYMFNPSGGAPKLTASGNAHLHGAVSAHGGVDMQLTGGFVLKFDKGVLENLKNSPSARGLARIPGAWSDVQDVQ